jgi:small subunit ribosomal protein S8
VLTDPIADLLTRIRNGGRARHVSVSMADSRMRREIARVLKESGYIQDFSSDQDPKKPQLTIQLRYHTGRRSGIPIIEQIERVSRPGRRVYVGQSEIPRVRNGIGIAILSTPHGILTDAEAREQRVGGEVLARLW